MYCSNFCYRSFNTTTTKKDFDEVLDTLLTHLCNFIFPIKKQQQQQKKVFEKYVKWLWNIL